MYDFAYHRAADLKAAEEALRKSEDGTLLAGGMTLIPTLKQRLAAPSDLIDLGAIEGLAQIEDHGERIVIGAMARHAAVADSPLVQQAIPALAHLASMIGDPQVRNRGTLGGSLATNDPAADYPAALVGLDATVMTTRREIAADDFVVDIFETALEEGEILTGVSFPKVRQAAYVKFPNPASRYALVGVFAAQLPSGPRVAVTGAGPCVFRLTAAETALATRFDPSVLSDLRPSAEGLNSDLHAAADYRAHLIGVLTRRAVAAALGP